MAWSHRQPSSGEEVRPGSLDAPCSLLASQFLTLSCSSTSGISQFISANMHRGSLCAGPRGGSGQQRGQAVALEAVPVSLGTPTKPKSHLNL